jgi:hypothetical protein
MSIRLPARKQRSIQPLLALMVIIGMSNLAASLGAFPILSMLMRNSESGTLHQIELGISVVLVALGLLVWWAGSHMALRRLIVSYATFATIILVASLIRLVLSLPNYGPAQANILLAHALVVWTMTVLTFSIWYWLIDSGWSEEQEGNKNNRPHFVFVQQGNAIAGWESWTPRYVDYLHLAYNTSTAFSPTDVSPLSGRAKLLMMTQSSLSLIVVATVLARAINILAS